MISRYTRWRSRPLPNEKRNISLKGKGEDKGKYYRCWNCGAICDVTRETLNLPRGGVNVTQYVDLGEPIMDDDNSIRLCADSIGFNYQVIPQESPDGTPVNTYGGFDTKVHAGCWFCGCTTWNGQ